MLKRGAKVFRGSRTFVKANRGARHLAVDVRYTRWSFGLGLVDCAARSGRQHTYLTYTTGCLHNRHYWGSSLVLWLTQRFGPMATQARKRPLDGPLAAEDEEQKRLKLADESEKIRREINTAGMKQDARKALELFDEALERDLLLNQKSLQTILHLISGGEAWLSALDSPDKLAAVRKLCARDKDLYKYMKTKNIEMNEFMYTGLARIAVLMGHPEGAFRIANDCRAKSELPTSNPKNKPRLRTYTPALLGFCRADNVKMAMEVEGVMNRLELALTPPEYKAMLSAATRTKNESYGSYILECMLREVTKIEENLAVVVEEYFNSRHLMLEEGEAGKYKVERTKINADGVCSVSGKTLDKLDLKHGELMTLAEKIQGLALKRETKGEAFMSFVGYVKRNGPFDIIIDGANVGFFGQSKQGIFTFSQVEAMLKKCKERWPESRPLVMLHSRRVNQFVREGRKNADAVDRMKRSKQLVTTPPGSNDDWYWLYASVLAGEKGLVVTNDEMRDHIFQTLESRSFQTWKAAHQVRFQVYDNKVDLVEPGKYTTAIQRKGQDWWFPITKEKVVRARHEKKIVEVTNPGMLKTVEAERPWVCCTYEDL